MPFAKTNWQTNFATIQSRQQWVLLACQRKCLVLFLFFCSLSLFSRAALSPLYPKRAKQHIQTNTCICRVHVHTRLLVLYEKLNRRRRPLFKMAHDDALAIIEKGAQIYIGSDLRPRGLFGHYQDERGGGHRSFFRRKKKNMFFSCLQKCVDSLNSIYAYISLWCIGTYEEPSKYQNPFKRNRRKGIEEVKANERFVAIGRCWNQQHQFFFFSLGGSLRALWKVGTTQPSSVFRL